MQEGRTKLANWNANKKFDLTKGGVVDKLLMVAMPTIATQFVMMSYNLVDMFLLGRVGSKAVAASGAAGMYLWLGGGFMILGRMGAEIGVAQNLGRGDVIRARHFSQHSFLLALVIGLLWMLVCLFLAGPLIGFFNIREPEVAKDSIAYLRLISVGFPFIFVSAAIAGTFNGAGNARVPFAINAAALLLNIVLDPIFIFTLNMGVAGAAIATSIAQIAAAAFSVYALLKRPDRPFERFRFTLPMQPGFLAQILKWGLPIGAEEFLFSFFTMFISRATASFGAGAIAVYRIGTQIEALTWLICMGFSTALTAFIGQNYGAGRWDRIRSCTRASFSIIIAWGAIVTVLLLLSGGFLFRLFIQEEPLIIMGTTFLRILAICQIPVCVEAAAGGAFRGLGRTLPPSIVSAVCNALRVPLAYGLATTTLGLDGIWWGITIGATIRGIWIFAWFLRTIHSQKSADGTGTPVYPG